MSNPAWRRGDVLFDQKGLRVERKIEKGIVIFTLTGEIDLSNSSRLDMLLGLGLEEGKHRVVLHMSDLRYLDSSGIGVIVRNLKAALKEKGDLKFCALPKYILSIFAQVKLDKLINIYSTLDDALEAFS